MKGILFFDNGEYVNVDFDFYKNIDTSTQYHRSKLEKKNSEAMERYAT